MFTGDGSKQPDACGAAVRVLFALGALWSAAALAHETDTGSTIEEVVVYGRATQQIGEATSASEGVVGYSDITMPPLYRVGELVEAVPGLVATQHSGTGKANQYFLRGFNLDHGTDFSANIEGMPLNMPTHGHGQGYLDLNFMIPELVEVTRYRKGPYDASVGDFSSAGSAAFTLYDHTQDTAAVTVGGNDYYRVLGMGSVDAYDGELIAAADGTFYAGPWDIDEHLRQYKGVVRYVRSFDGATARFTLMGYDGSWDSTDQIPERAVREGITDKFGYIDPNLGGEAHRYSLQAEVDAESWRANVYAISSQLDLYSNFTYFLDDPVNGDEFHQHDDRRVYGGTLQGEITRTVAGLDNQLRWGVQTRYDDIDSVGLFHTVDRQRIGEVRDDTVDEFSGAGWFEIETPWTSRLRTVVGARADYYHYDVDSDLAANSGTGQDHITGLKSTLAYRFTDYLEGYANWGQGFHSNDVRGATITVDPTTGGPAAHVNALVPSEGYEVGLRTEFGKTFNATVAVFRLDLDSELVYAGDAGTTEPLDATKRIGVETTLFWQPLGWLALNAVYAYTDARFKSNDAGGRYIPNSVESTATFGATAIWNRWSGSLRVRYLGPSPLIEDNSVRSDGSTLVNLGVNYQLERLEFRLDLFNALDSGDADISYYYASRLPGEPADGVEDVHFHPMEPRTLRGSVIWHW
ncbi:MAG TPA: TonB-dependent receptor [Pseudomonadales bacterium]|nr:TonB-dependent receptor [Pseudomonadales bacterium]